MRTRAREEAEGGGVEVAAEGGGEGGVGGEEGEVAGAGVD